MSKQASELGATIENDTAVEENSGSLNESSQQSTTAAEASDKTKESTVASAKDSTPSMTTAKSGTADKVAAASGSDATQPPSTSDATHKTGE